MAACRPSFPRQLQRRLWQGVWTLTAQWPSTVPGSGAVHQQQKSRGVAYQMMTCSFQLTVSGRHLLCSRASANVKVARAIRHTTITMAAKLKEILVLSLFCRRQGLASLGLKNCQS